MHIEWAKKLVELEAAVQQENHDAVFITAMWWLTHKWSAAVATKCLEGVRKDKEAVGYVWEHFDSLKLMMVMVG